MAVWGAVSPWGLTTWSAGGAVASLPGAVSTVGAEAQESALGVDIFFGGNYEITAAGDLALVRGFAALNQSIYHRLITRPGEFVMRPGYGVGIQRWVKRSNKVAQLHQLEQTVRDQLSFDKRISRVKQVFVDDLDDAPGVILGFDIEAIGRTIEFRPLTFAENGVSLA